MKKIDQEYSVGNSIREIHGERMNFKFYELTKKYEEKQKESNHEYFFYVLDGKLNFSVNNKSYEVDKGSIIKVDKGQNYMFSNISENSRLVTIFSNDFLESKIT